MSDKKQEPIELSSVEVELNNLDKNNGGIFEKFEVQSEVPLSCLNQEKTESGVSENGLDKGSDGIIEKVELPVVELGRVSITDTENEKVAISSKDEEKIVNESGVSGSIANNELKGDTESGSASESESASSSSAASSSDEEEDESSSNEEEEEGKVDMEEGEIVGSDPDEMVAWDDDEEDTGAKGPIKSKNEVQVLPPVPEVTATLQPQHQMQPVGVVTSILGAQVVVEGVEKHTPLYDGSILWITESRSPLGIIDEIFGPVKNPYYIVRYNSDNEVPPGIHPGTLISFVPEFSSHILNDNSLYKKGYDASGENDEEVSEDEFSDDEKEAEYKKMLKMKKRGVTNDQKPGNKKKDKRNLKNRSQNWKQHDQGAATDVQHENGKPSVDQSQRFIPAASGPLDQGIRPNASLQGHGKNITPPFPHMENPLGLAAPSNGVWNNGIPYQQPQNMGFPNGLPNMGMPWAQQGHPQQMFQMPTPNALPFEQQINPNLPSGFMFPGGLPNFGAGPSFAPWPALGQNVFGQTPLPMGLPGQFTPTPMNFGGQVPANGPQSGQNNNSQFTSTLMNFGGLVPTNGPRSGQNNNSQPGQFTPTPMNFGGQVPANGPQSGQNNNSGPGYNNGSPNFNRGARSGGGRRENHRGGGRFGGRRGRSQRN
ncbi:H/ACA ribonucleoprotein complex non-core subunit NAF1 isoform X2 [Lycium barbarum]|nr:H/ACA ribonucleoprotein complex non-core subunit NAF1 isoform X2 [Lycium barbarum]